MDYGFYTDIYLGSAISQKAFPGLIARAEAFLDRLKGCCRVECAGEESEKMALCAVAEAVQAQQKRQGIKSTSVGGVSVSYDTGAGSLRGLYEAAAVYLDIYRGGGLMENPFPYPLCDRTVTVYRENGERTVCEGCYFVYEDVENESAEGLRVDRKFLLVMPGAQRVFAGDRIYDGIGPEEIVWAEFVPAAVPGLCQAAYAKAWCWDGHVCHTEAGRK